MKKWLTYASSSNWLRVVGVGTIILLTAYVLIQQSTRLAADDLPLATAQTISHELADGMAAQAAVPPVKTDLKTDSTVFATVVDSSYKVLASSGQLDGAVSLPPTGSFGGLPATGVNRFTWQPEPGVRIATVIVPFSHGSTSGFVIAGQSLKQAESRIADYGWITLAGWLGIVLWATFIPIPVRQSS